MRYGLHQNQARQTQDDNEKLHVLTDWVRFIFHLPAWVIAGFLCNSGCHAGPGSVHAGRNKKFEQLDDMNTAELKGFIWDQKVFWRKLATKLFVP
jgi:hypothetical protein